MTDVEIDERIEAHRRRFDELLAAAQTKLERGDAEAGARLAQVAAALAWHSPTGLFSSPRLESLLATIGQRLATTANPATKTAGTDASGARGSSSDRIGSVLHVFTTAYLVGGHTRLAWRWIERDGQRRHSAAVTRQGFEPIPRPLAEAVAASGGDVVRVDRAAGDLLGRARSMAMAAATVDVVVLHTHPFDVVPPLALQLLRGTGSRPPTIVLNHADHLFWIGLRAADLVLHLRASGSRLSIARRGLPEERSAILPLPLPTAQPAADRDAARRRFGYSERDVVAVSIASGYKFGPAGGTGLLDLVRRAGDRRSSLRVLAVGPGGRPDWVEAERSTSGRIRALGLQPDVGPVYAAADIYLDSYPFSSLTSMLEAGQRGLPLLARTGGVAGTEVLSFDDPATDGLPVGAATEAAFAGSLDRLVDDAPYRRELGQRIAAALEAVHEGERWRERLEAAYATVLELHRAGGRADPDHAAIDPPVTTTELDRRLVVLLDAQQSDAPAGVRGHLRLAPLDVRLVEWRRARTSARPLSVLVLLPEWLVMAARRATILGQSLRRSWRSRRLPTPEGR